MPQPEFHQLDRRLENLRLRHPSRQRRLIASLAESGQQTPIIVLEQSGRYLVIDGHKRIAALQQLCRDTVEAVVWAMSEADALVLERTLVMGEPPGALEQGWLLREMKSRLGFSIEELARRFDRSRHRVASRLALVETLPESVQQLVREGKLAPSLAMRYRCRWRAATSTSVASAWPPPSNKPGPHGRPASSTKPGAERVGQCANVCRVRRSCSAKHKRHPRLRSRF